MRKKAVVKRIRKAIYWPFEHLSDLPGGPLRYMWLVRLIVKVDAPLRRYMLGDAANAKPNT